MANRIVIIKDAEKLKEFIIKSGSSYRQFAKAVKCSQTQISLLLNGQRNPSPSLAINICNVLNKQFEEIFFIKSDCKRNQK